MKTLSSSLKLAALVAMIFSFSQAFAGSGSKQAKADVVGMLFYADWCGSCQILDPKIETAEKAFSGKPITFTKLDLTDSKTRAKAEKNSKKLGMESVFAEHGKKTGFFLLVDAESKEVISKITREYTEDQIKSEIKSALKAKA